MASGMILDRLWVQVWCPDQHHQHHQETGQKCRCRAMSPTCRVTDSGEGALQSVLNKLSWLSSCSGGHGIKHQEILVSLQETSALIPTYVNDHDLGQAVNTLFPPPCTMLQRAWLLVCPCSGGDTVQAHDC